MDEFKAHSDGISCLEFSYNKLFTGSFDHCIKYWNIAEISYRIVDRVNMAAEDEYCKMINYAWNK